MTGMWTEFMYNYNYEIVLSARKVGPLITYNSTTAPTIEKQERINNVMCIILCTCQNLKITYVC